jgi:hypothetical protein
LWEWRGKSGCLSVTSRCASDDISQLGRHTTWFSVCCAFDFGYATELVIVPHQLATHQLVVLASARYDQKSFTIEVLMRRSEAFCYAAHIFPGGCFRGTRAARCCPEYIEDHYAANAGTSAPDAR